MPEMSKKVTSKTMKELYIEYGVSWLVFRSWVQKIHKKLGIDPKARVSTFTPKQVKIMYEHFGEPGE